MNRQNFQTRRLVTTLFLSISVSIASTLAWAAPKKPTPKHSVKASLKSSKKSLKATPKKIVKKQSLAPAKPKPDPKVSDVMIIEGGTQNADGSISVGETEETAVDLAVDLEVDLGELSSGSRSDFNPYNFERDPLWILLPALTLVLLGLHLLPVPKRKLKKLTPQTKLFSGIDGKENTKSVTSTTKGEV